MNQDLLAEALVAFRELLDEARAAGDPEPTAMTLATAAPDGRVAARIVLLKAHDERGFVFYTNYDSRKGQEVEARDSVARGRAALLFWWEPLSRQVRIEGTVVRVSDEESDAYFASRPRESNLSAMASPQSQVVDSRGWLAERVRDLDRAWAGKALVRPPSWGGYRVVPERLELWQGRPDRLHDRLCYRWENERWRIERLAP